MVAEYAVEFEYLVDVDGLSLRHRHRVRVALADPLNPPEVGTDPSNIELATKGIGGVPSSKPLDEAMNDYLGVFCPLFGANMTVVSGSLTYYQNGIGRAGAWVSPLNLSGTGTITSVAGSNANPASPTRQAIIWFFDSRGKLSKFSLMEITLSSNDVISSGALPIEYTNYANYLIGFDSVIKGSETSTLLATKGGTFGQNEAIWRKRHRS